MKTADVNYVSKMLTAIGENTRLRIAVALSAKEYDSVAALAKDCGQNVTSTSSHLKVLRDAGVVQVEKDGRQRVYSLSKDVFNGKGFVFGPATLQFAAAEKPAKATKKK